jgi:hypothetical protein
MVFVMKAQHVNCNSGNNLVSVISVNLVFIITVLMHLRSSENFIASPISARLLRLYHVCVCVCLCVCLCGVCVSTNVSV